MTSTGSSGSNGLVFGFRQNSTNVATFGDYYSSGNSSGPIYISIVKNLTTQLVLNKLGIYTYQFGLQVKLPNGTIIY